MRYLAHLRVLLTTTFLAGLVLTLAACQLGGSGNQDKSGSVMDPLVRERILARINEIYEPAKADAEKVRELSAKKECRGVCRMSVTICDASKRVCDLAADFPKSDEEAHEQCSWSQADCGGAKVSCAGCGGLQDDEEE